MRAATLQKQLRRDPQQQTAAICPDNFIAYANTTDPIRCVCTADGIKGGTAAICPDNFVAYANTTDPIRCVCTADAIKGGSSVWGMDTYTGDSSVCRAALHAGVVGQSGGPVTAIPEPGRDAYPGVTRNWT